MEFGIEPGQSHLENYGCSFQAVVGTQTDYKAGISRRSYVQQGREGEEGGKARMLRVLISAGARPPLAIPHPRSGCVYTQRGECTLWIVT